MTHHAWPHRRRLSTAMTAGRDGKASSSMSASLASRPSALAAVPVYELCLFVHAGLSFPLTSHQGAAGHSLNSHAENTHMTRIAATFGGETLSTVCILSVRLADFSPLPIVITLNTSFVVRLLVSYASKQTYQALTTSVSTNTQHDTCSLLAGKPAARDGDEANVAWGGAQVGHQRREPEAISGDGGNGQGAGARRLATRRDGTAKQHGWTTRVAYTAATRRRCAVHRRTP